MDSDLLDFIPVPLRNRRGGWTADRQRAFIASIARGLRAGRAAALLGLSRQSAYLLRDHPEGASFAAAWDRASAAAGAARRRELPPSELQRAVDGVLHPIRYRGRIVAWERRFSEAALLRLLGRHVKLIEKREIGSGDISPGIPKLCQEPEPGSLISATRKSGA